jgi:hypothetical protein
MVTPKNAKGLTQKTSDEKVATLNNEKGLIKRTSDAKRSSPQG